MQAGKLRHQVALEGLVTGSPQFFPSGAPNEAWGQIASVWASIEPLQGRELLTAQQFQSEIKARIRIRYRSDVTTTTRVTFEGKVYNILAVIDRELRHIELELMVSEGLNLG